MMNKEEQMLCGHLTDLAEASYQRGRMYQSDFLTLYEQNLFLSNCLHDLSGASYELTGGYEDAERKVIFFYPEGRKPEKFPLTMIQIRPLNKKFAEELTHRDYLGALMNLGIERSRTGDILIADDWAIVICAESVKPVIMEQLTRIRHTSVVCEEVEQENFSYTPKTRLIEGTVASLRLDALIGLAFSSSRSSLISYIEEEKVSVCGKCITSNAYQVKEKDVISVRGLGKFRLRSINQVTRKGRISVSVDLYI